AYVRGEMGTAERQLFENKYLVSEMRRNKVAAARAFDDRFRGLQPVSPIAEPAAAMGILDYVSSFFKPGRVAFAGGFAALLVVLAAGIWWIAIQPNRYVAVNGNSNSSPDFPERFDEINPVPPPTIDSANIDGNNNNDTNRKSNIKTPPTGNTDKPVKQKEPGGIFAFSLMPPLRSSERPVLKIPSSARTVQLRLIDNFGEKYVKYSAELTDDRGNSIWSWDVAAGKKLPQKSITVNIPATKLKSGSYELSVIGITVDGSVEEINFYNFIAKKGGDEQE
ncbi:MAG: hypothetical protein ACRD6X_11890, partial [Pyrinomonadaceae bacterium]